MKYKQQIQFISVDEDIKGAITKFGGQPNWISSPQWPLSKKLKIPMRFICQINLENAKFKGGNGKMTYVFMTDTDEYVEGTYEADGGENAVIIQNGGKLRSAVDSLDVGPTLQVYDDITGSGKRQPRNVIFSTKLIDGFDPDFINENILYKMEESKSKMYIESLGTNKIGGTPGFIQADEFPDNEQEWSLLLELDSNNVPFSINFGDSGVGYAFINAEATEGRFLWQCC